MATTAPAGRRPNLSRCCARPIHRTISKSGTMLVTVPMVLVVVSLTWGLIRLAPGNFYSGEKPLPPAIVKNIRDKYGLDKPWYVQYGKMLSNTLHGDFGSSLKYQGQPVNSILKD